MSEARELVEIMVATMIVECLGIILVALILYLRTPKEPHDIFRVPDYVPSNWDPEGDLRRFQKGGDGTGTNPERQKPTSN